MVDIDRPALQKKIQQLPFDECIYSDAKVFINMLINRVREMRQSLPDFSSWIDRVNNWKEK